MKLHFKCLKCGHDFKTPEYQTVIAEFCDCEKDKLMVDWEPRIDGFGRIGGDIQKLNVIEAPKKIRKIIKIWKRL